MSDEDCDDSCRPYPCRNEQCNRRFASSSNRNRHEKRFGHSPPERRGAIQLPVFDETTSEYRCPFPRCEISSAYKFNVTRHINAGCPTLKKKNTKVCPHCRKTFTQKSNRDRHVKRFHPTEEATLPGTSQEHADIPLPTFDDNLPTVFNVSIEKNDGASLKTSYLIKRTRMYQGHFVMGLQFFPYCIFR